MNTRPWLFAAPFLMAASVASAAYEPVEVYFAGAGGSSYFVTDSSQVEYVDSQNPYYAGSGVQSVADLTGQNWVATTWLEASPVTFTYGGPGTGFLLNTLTIASVWSPNLTLEISGYYHGTAVGTYTASNLGKAAKTIDLGWTTEITSFDVSIIGADPSLVPPSGANWALGSVNVTAVPEPESYAMLLAGLAIVGAVARRRRAFTHA